MKNNKKYLNPEKVKKHEENMLSRQDKQKANSNMICLKPNTSVFTLHVKRLNTPI